MLKKMKTCVVCGFASSKGTIRNASFGGAGPRASFVCSACEREMADEEERRYAEQEEAESARDYCRAVERY